MMGAIYNLDRYQAAWCDVASARQIARAWARETGLPHGVIGHVLRSTGATAYRVVQLEAIAAPKADACLRTARGVLQDVLEDARAIGAIDDDDQRLELVIANLAAMDGGT